MRPSEASRPAQPRPSSRRWLVIGCAGAGKSVFSRRLADLLDLPVVHLDELYWGPGWVPTPSDEWRGRVAELVRQDAWIMDFLRWIWRYPAEGRARVEARLAGAPAGCGIRRLHANAAPFCALPRIRTVERGSHRGGGPSRPSVRGGACANPAGAVHQQATSIRQETRP